MSYFPTDRDILTSSLWAQGTSDQRVIWFYLMLSADPRSGIVNATVPAIAVGCVLPLETVEQCLEWLCRPDRYSRTKDHDGRRIEFMEDGRIRLITYIQHKEKDYSTPRVQKWREQKGKSEIESAPNAGPAYPSVGDICPCCSRQFQTPFKLYVVLDHNHRTGQLRAYICQSCNKLVGQKENQQFVREDSVAYVEAYLKRFQLTETVSALPETTDTDTNTETKTNSDAVHPDLGRAHDEIGPHEFTQELVAEIEQHLPDAGVKAHPGITTAVANLIAVGHPKGPFAGNGDRIPLAREDLVDAVHGWILAERTDSWHIAQRARGEPFTFSRLLTHAFERLPDYAERGRAGWGRSLGGGVHGLEHERAPPVEAPVDPEITARHQARDAERVERAKAWREEKPPDGLTVRQRRSWAEEHARRRP